MPPMSVSTKAVFNQLQTWGSLSAVDVSIEIVIHAPLETVAGLASNPDNALLWYVNINPLCGKLSRPCKLVQKLLSMHSFLAGDCPIFIKLKSGRLARNWLCAHLMDLFLWRLLIYMAGN